MSDHRLLGRSRLRMRHLSIILALRRHGSMRSAADELGLSQPAVTKALQEMEHLFGTSFFVRGARGITPTSTGEAIARFATAMSTDLGLLEQELAQLQSGGLGEVKVGGVMAAITPILAPAIVKATSDHPGLKIGVHIDTSDGLVSALQDGRLDFAVGRIPDGWARSGLAFDPLEEEDLSVVASRSHPALSRAGETKLADLAQHKWVLQPSPSPMRHIIDEIFRETDIHAPTNVVETSSMLMTLALLNEAHMIAVMPRSVARTFSDADLVRILPTVLHRKLGPYGLLTRAGRPLSKSAALLIGYIEAAAPIPKAVKQATQ